MEPSTPPDTDELANKIARLVEERGWNQEEFARKARLNRHTARQILLSGGHRNLRNSTILGCANALGLTVNDLRTLPLDRLIARIADNHPASGKGGVRRLWLQAGPELRAWVDRNPERGQQLSDEEVDELLALQEAGSLSAFGVEGFVERLERRRNLIRQVTTIAGTEYLELLEKMVGLVYDKVRPDTER